MGRSSMKSPSLSRSRRNNTSPRRGRGSARPTSRNAMKKVSFPDNKPRSPLFKRKLNTTNEQLDLAGVSSYNSLNEDVSADDEDEDNEDSSEEDNDGSAGFAPPYGMKKNIGRKAGRNRGLSAFQNRSKLKLIRNHRDEVGTGSVCSVSSVSSVSVPNSDDSDYAGYEGVDEVSDGEDEEKMLEKVEEDMILESENERNSGFTHLDIQGTRSDVCMELDVLEHQPSYSTGSFFDDEHPLTQPGNCNTVDADETAETLVPRRVHFESDDSSNSDEEDDVFPDFLHQDRLDPDFRRMIEADSGSTKKTRNAHDLFINSDFCDIPDNIYHVEESDNSIQSSSDYESDEGETTDEEDYPPPATITHPRSILRRESSASLPVDVEGINQPSQSCRRRGPLRGTFVADPYKPVAVVAPNGKQLILIPPYASSRHDWLESAANSLINTASNSPRASTTNNIEDSDTDALTSPQAPEMSPMLSSNANLMMSALGNDSLGQVMGPPEAFYPTDVFPMDASFDDEEDDSEALLNVDDFIDFGDGSSDDEVARELVDMEDPLSPATASAMGSVTPTPNRVTMEPPQANNAEKLLNHLDRGIVTAFRRNHSRYQALIRLPHHREFLPKNSPSQTASAFKRSKVANTRTPTRKRQASTQLGSEAVRRKLIDSHRRNTINF